MNHFILLILTLLVLPQCAPTQKTNSHIFYESEQNKKIIFSIHDKRNVINDIYKERKKEIPVTKQPSFHGRVLLSWDINEQGKPESFHVDETFDSTLSTRMINEIKTWSFPPDPDKKIIHIGTMPFLFKP